MTEAFCWNTGHCPVLVSAAKQHDWCALCERAAKKQKTKNTSFPWPTPGRVKKIYLKFLHFLYKLKSFLYKYD